MRKVERLRRAIGRNPTSAILHQGLGRTYAKLKSYREARICFEVSLDLDKADLWTNLYLGNSYFREKDYATSLKFFKAARDLDTDVAMPLVCLADTYHRLGLNDRAGRLYREAVRIDPESEIARRNLERWEALSQAGLEAEQDITPNR